MYRHNLCLALKAGSQFQKDGVTDVVSGPTKRPTEDRFEDLDVYEDCGLSRDNMYLMLICSSLLRKAEVQIVF